MQETASEAITPEAAKGHYHLNVRADIFPLVPARGGTLVDIGGGVGNTAFALKQLGRADRVGVVDLYAPPAGGPALDFAMNGNLEDAAFLDRLAAEHGPFETILCLDVLEHLVDPWTLIARLHSMLAPGGVIVASLPNIRHFSALGPLLLKNQWRLKDSGILDRTHLRFFVRQSAIELMTSSGLVLDEVSANPSGGWRVRWFRRLSLGLLNSFSDQQYLIRVRKPATPGERPAREYAAAP
jgi:2-polyprenyl-3-methyl-5-hydroxy-6-metoxy-1,4-benzoquinol methylase